MGRTTTAVLRLGLLVVALTHRNVGAQVPGFDLSCDAPLGIDEAMLFLRGFRDLGDGAYPLAFQYQSTNCHGCDLIPLATLAHANATVCCKVSTKWATRLRASWTAEYKSKPQAATQLLARSVERTVKLTEKAFVTVEVAGNAAAADGTPAVAGEAAYALLVAQAGGYPTYRPLLYLIWAGLGILCIGWLLHQFAKDSPAVAWLLRHIPRPPSAVVEPQAEPPVVAAMRLRARLDIPTRPAAGGWVDAGVGRGGAMVPPLEEVEELLDEEEMLYREYEAHEQALQAAQPPAGPAQPSAEQHQQPQEPPQDMGQQYAELSAGTGAKQRRRSVLTEGNEGSTSTIGGRTASSHGAAEAEDDDRPTPAPQPPVPREKALDVLRGLSVLGMVFVNYGGGGYAIFAHSAWDGLTLADLLFPAFVLVSGAAASLSLRQLQQRLDALAGLKGDDESKRGQKRRARRAWALKREALGKVRRRALVLFALGLFLNNGYEVSHWRVPGVLQYLAWSNLLIPALLILAARVGPPAEPQAPTTTTTTEPSHMHLRARAQEWTQRLARLLFPAPWWEPCAALLLPTLHLALAYLVQAPGCPRGYVGPGGAHVDGGRLAHCTGGAYGYLDRLLFSGRHLLQDPPCRAVYGTGPFDPEGVVGSLNAAFLFYLGVLAGRVLVAPAWPRRDPRRALGWLALAAPCALLAAVLGGSGAVPVNKSLWSLSFVLAAGAVALAAFAACHLLCNARGRAWPSGAPCAGVGRNALVIYVGHELLQNYFPFSFKLPAAFESTHGGALLQDTVGVLVWLGIGALLHWRQVYIKV